MDTPQCDTCYTQQTPAQAEHAAQLGGICPACQAEQGLDDTQTLAADYWADPADPVPAHQMADHFRMLADLWRDRAYSLEGEPGQPGR